MIIMNDIEKIIEIIKESKKTVFLVAPEYQQKVELRTFEVRMDYIVNNMPSLQKKSYPIISFILIQNISTSFIEKN